MKLPSVIALKDYIVPQSKPSFTRFNVFLRDKFSCQYCGSNEELTFDHLLPRSKGDKTLSAMAVGGFSSILANIEEHGPLRRNVTGQDVGETARYLLSDMGRGVTGQIIRVDCGTSAVAGLG